MPEKPPPIPHLIHIGFPKCASKFLQSWFSEHPQVAYQIGSFAGLRGVNELIADTLGRIQTKVCRVTSNEELSDPRDPATFSEVETTTGELRRAAVGRVCAELASLYPNAWILMITRNQADAAISGYSQLIKQGGYIREVDFTKFDSKGLRDLNPFNYDLALQIYREHFEGRILALPYELLVDDRSAFLAAIADYMGVDHFDIAALRVNQSLDDEQLYWYPRIARLLRLAPSDWLRRKLVALHCQMIRIGAWRPLLNLLKLLTGPKTVSRTLSPDILHELEIDCEELLRSELYAPYRELYRGSTRVTGAD